MLPTFHPLRIFELCVFTFICVFYYYYSIRRSTFIFITHTLISCLVWKVFSAQCSKRWKLNTCQSIHKYLPFHHLLEVNYPKMKWKNEKVYTHTHTLVTNPGDFGIILGLKRNEMATEQFWFLELTLSFCGIDDDAWFFLQLSDSLYDVSSLSPTALA